MFADPIEPLKRQVLVVLGSDGSAAPAKNRMTSPSEHADRARRPVPPGGEIAAALHGQHL
jgi:hypothetical protein